MVGPARLVPQGDTRVLVPGNGIVVQQKFFHTATVSFSTVPHRQCHCRNVMLPTPAGPGPYLPKPQFLYELLSAGIYPKRLNLVTSPDGDYWKAVRQATAPCFSMSNLKQVGAQSGGYRDVTMPQRVVLI